MRSGSTRRGASVLAVLAVVVVAALPAPAQAAPGLGRAPASTAEVSGAVTIEVCVNRRTGAVRVVKRSKKCARSEKRRTWFTAGPAGPAGPAGVAGATGATGPAGPFPDVLPSGRTLRGTYALILTATVGGQQIGQGISYLASLPGPLTADRIHYVKLGTAPPAPCAGGTAATPIAAPGHLCVFEAQAVNVTDNRGVDDPVTVAAPGSSAPAFGFGVYATCGALGVCRAAGSWAVTAP